MNGATVKFYFVTDRTPAAEAMNLFSERRLVDQELTDETQKASHIKAHTTIKYKKHAERYLGLPRDSLSVATPLDYHDGDPYAQRVGEDKGNPGAFFAKQLEAHRKFKKGEAPQAGFDLLGANSKMEKDALSASTDDLYKIEERFGITPTKHDKSRSIEAIPGRIFFFDDTGLVIRRVLKSASLSSKEVNVYHVSKNEKDRYYYARQVSRKEPWLAVSEKQVPRAPEVENPEYDVSLLRARDFFKWRNIEWHEERAEANKALLSWACDEPNSNPLTAKHQLMRPITKEDFARAEIAVKYDFDANFRSGGRWFGRAHLSGLPEDPNQQLLVVLYFLRMPPPKKAADRLQLLENYYEANRGALVGGDIVYRRALADLDAEYLSLRSERGLSRLSTERAFAALCVMVNSGDFPPEYFYKLGTNFFKRAALDQLAKLDQSKLREFEERTILRTGRYFLDMRTYAEPRIESVRKLFNLEKKRFNDASVFSF